MVVERKDNKKIQNSNSLADEEGGGVNRQAKLHGRPAKFLSVPTGFFISTFV
jgi:hypothetical protein